MAVSELSFVALVAHLSFSSGMSVGYIKTGDNKEPAMEASKQPCIPDNLSFVYVARSESHVGRCVDTCRSDACQAESCELIQPRSYVSYHLQGKTINIDGKIDEEAWEEVSWTEDFVDLAGVDYPTPHFNTKAKLRWDDTFLYVAARLQEDNVWANKTEHDSKVWQDNAFEIYVDTDGTTHNYKEFQINALKTTWDLRLTKAYLDGGSAQSNWESDAQYGVFTDGVVNDPSTPSTFWSAEIALPFQNLRMNSLQPKAGPPGDNAIWRMVLARPEWGFQITSDGRYIKDETVSASWWSWQPHGVINLHLPNMWGVVQFSRAAVDSQVFTPNEQWKMSEALFAAFNTMQKYKAEFGIYTTDTKLLDLPQLLRTDLCFMKPTIELVNSTFVVSISNKDNTLTGHIRADRYVWFGDKDTGLRVP